MLKKLFLWVLILAVVYSMATIYMPWFRNYLFQKDLDEFIKEVGYQTISHTRGKVLISARQNGIPVNDDNLVTVRDESTGLVTFEAQYTVTVKLGGEVYAKVWNFHPKATRAVHVTPGTGSIF
jgi:hypothetical protein